MAKFSEKTVVITGAGAGMGRASAIEFAKEGANVVAIDLNFDAAEETVELISKEPGEAFALECDVSNEKNVNQVIQTVIEKFGRVDVLFNNAGTAMEKTNTEDVSEKLVNRIIDVNLKGVFWGSKAVIPIMKKQGSGVILNTASMTGVRQRPGLNIYGASKAAVISLTKGIALEVAEFGVRVIAINPVSADTGLLKDFIGHDKDYDEGAKSFVSTIPIGRLAKADDIAKAAIFLASDDASLITGTCLDIDGGRGV